MAKRKRRSRAVNEEFNALLAKNEFDLLVSSNQEEADYIFTEPTIPSTNLPCLSPTLLPESPIKKSSDKEYTSTTHESAVSGDPDETDLSNESSTSLENITIMTNAEKLAVVAIKNKLTHTAINDIAALMIDLGIVLPKDARTILRTQRKPVVDDSFLHLGLESGIVNCLRFGFTSETNFISFYKSNFILQVNIDGIPLFNSSNTSFWPILCRIIGAIDSSPFAISVYCGKSKPPNLIEFLSPFLNELISLISNGLRISKKLYTVKLVAIISDAPARSYLKALVGHTGYGARERCCQKGTRVKN